MTSVPLEQHTVVVEPGSPLQWVYFPAGMILSVVAIMGDGQGVEVCTVGHESAYGMLHALGHSTSTDRVVVQMGGGGYRIPATRFKAAAGSSHTLNDLAMRHIQLNLAQTQQSVACNALHNVEARLCRWLLMSQDRSTGSKLPLTQEYLGFMLGVQRTTVTGAAQMLQSAGLIRYVRGQIEILDREGLKNGACECYLAVQTVQNTLLTRQTA